tara:strand:+ start:483 stop:1505 length:1023 start_codon:yes stop_codon:yes gene_type:complete
MRKSYFIAEIGVNHSGSIDLALEMVTNAKLAGASAVKFQTYDSHKLAAEKSPSYWDLNKEPTNSQRDLFKKFECTDLSFYLPIIKECKRLDIDFLTTCFDIDLVDIFDPYLKTYKISSSDLTNRILIQKIVSKNKPIILSCGASSYEEIQNAVSFINASFSSDLSLLHCVLNYPCSPENANIKMISSLKNRFKNNCKSFGYSCHVPMPEGLDCCLYAFSLGASIIEKHFTNSRLRVGNDHYHAMTAEDLKNFRDKEAYLIKIMGKGEPQLGIQNAARNNARRSLYASKDLKIGDIFSSNNIIALRPLKGISAEKVEIVYGKKINKNKLKGEPIYSEDIIQ